MPKTACALMFVAFALVHCAYRETEIVGSVPLEAEPDEGGESGGGGDAPGGGGGSDHAGAGGGGGRGGSTAEGGAGGATGGSGGAVGGAAGSATGGAAGAANGGAGGSAAGGAAGAGSGRFSMLVFHKVAGFRHDSIPAGLKMLRDLGEQNDFEVTATTDASVFTEAGLEKYAVIFFLLTTDDVLNNAQQAAMEAFIRKGRGYAGVHSATDTEDGFGWAWYEELVGSVFTGHGPADEPGTLKVEPGAAMHPAVKDLPQLWNRSEEWYRFRRNVTGLAGVKVLLRLAADDRPMAWTREWDGGRAFYTALGHATSAYAEPLFAKHVLGGILWAAGRAR